MDATVGKSRQLYQQPPAGFSYQELVSVPIGVATSGFGVALTPTQSWSFHTALESAIGGRETASLRTFATA